MTETGELSLREAFLYAARMNVRTLNP